MRTVEILVLAVAALLSATLKKHAIGEATGGGSQLSAPDRDGKRSVEWIGIDVDLTDFEKGLPILKSELLGRIPVNEDTEQAAGRAEYSAPYLSAMIDITLDNAADFL